ncbi:MAG: glycosyltransferase family 39 protein [Alphaproteobacteria bacterium]|nr:glycosyltransferase family 39 protein [Alphaproteobacteria bacterium]
MNAERRHPTLRSHGLVQSAAYPVCVFLAVFLVYIVNYDVLIGNDAKSNTFLPVSILSEGNLSFTADEAPFMFVWRARGPAGNERNVRIANFAHKFRGGTAREMRDRGDLWPVAPSYFITPTRHEGVYVSTFGPGVGLFALPLVTAGYVLNGGLAGQNMALLWYLSKVVAALAVAGSALILFFIAQRHVSRKGALIVTGAYAFGTCVWSISSQALWQHGPTELFVMLGIYFLSRIGARRNFGYYCGLALAAAVLCRPTSAPLAVTVGLYLLMIDRAALWRFIVGGLPIAILLFAYNYHYFGSPLDFGQLVQGAGIAASKTGSADVWQTPLWLGAAGLLFSPSRGLLIFSPVMGFAAWGVVRMWHAPSMGWLKPVLAALMLMWIIAFKWFDWWGGWSFGYRPIVDTMPLLAVLLLPAIDTILTSRIWIRMAFAATLLWSVSVQYIGAFAYDIVGWNDRVAVFLPGDTEPTPVVDSEEIARLRLVHGSELKAVRLDIDRPENRHRLWSLGDSQIAYYLANFGRARQRKKTMMDLWIRDPTR